MTKRAVLYARVSKDDRRNATSSLKNQLQLCQDHAQKQGWHIVAELEEDDRGASGASFDLPQLNRAIEMARAGEYDVLVTRELDRLARDLAKQLITEKALKNAGVTIEYVLYDFPDTPQGQIDKHLRAVIAEYERDSIKLRMANGRRNKVKAGNVMSHGPAPYGYKKIVGEDKTVIFIIDEQAAAIVRMIFDWYAHKGIGANEITRKLTLMGVPTPTDIKNMRGVKKKKGYGQWCTATIHHILKNETYTGSWHYGKRNTHKPNDRSYWIPVTVPAIISPETWQAAVNRREHNIAHAKRNTKHDYLFRGVGTCGHCGFKMQTHSYKYTSSKRTTRYFYYRCPVRAYPLHYSPQTCDLPNFRADETDTAIWAGLRTYFMNPQNLAFGLRKLRQEQEKTLEPLRERLTVVESLISENESKLKRLLDLYLTGDFPKEVLMDRKKRLEDTLKVLNKEYGHLATQLEASLSDEQIQDIVCMAQEIAEGLDEANEDFEARRYLIERLDIQVTFAREQGDLVAYARGKFGLETRVIVSSNTNSTKHKPHGPVEFVFRIAVNYSSTTGSEDLPMLFFANVLQDSELAQG